MQKGKCDFCREPFNPPHAHYCPDEYIARLANLQDAVTVYLQAHEEFMKDQTNQTAWDQLEAAIRALPYSGDSPKAKLYMHRAQLAIRVADAAAYHFMEGDDTALEASVVEWLQYRYKWDRAVGSAEERDEWLRRCGAWLKQRNIYNIPKTTPRPKLLAMLETCRDLLSRLTEFTGDMVSAQLQQGVQDEQLP